MAIKIKKSGFWIDTGIKLDEELNKSNQAADAAITGDLIIDLEERTNKLVFGDSNATDISETIERLSTEIQPIERGGTGSNDGAQGLNNFLFEGQTVLSNHQYGESFPNLENSKSYTLFLKNKSKGIEDIPDNTIFDFLNKAYPIGSIYTTAKADDPSVLFGGTWERIKDRVLIGFGDTYTESVENVSKLNAVSSGYTIPGAMTVNMWKRTGMFELPDLTVAIYDDSFPLQWNSLEVAEIKNARNLSGMIKISNLIPTIEKMKKAFIDIDGEIFTYLNHLGTERDYSTVYEYTNGTNIFYIQVVKEGYSNLNNTLESGIYVENVFKKYGIDKNCQIYTKIYDDMFPLQWNSKLVAEAENAKTSGLVKISNLTPSEEEMKSAVINVGDEIFTYYETSTQDGIPSYQYWSENNRVVITVCAALGTTYFPETGMYVDDVYNASGAVVDYTLNIVEQPDIPDTPTGIYDDEFPIEWNSLSVVEAGNATFAIADAQFIKVSNLAPTEEQMMSATIVGAVGEESMTITLSTATDMDALYPDTGCMRYDGTGAIFLVFPTDVKTERGLYVLNQYGENSIDFTLSLPVTPTHYLYGHEAEATVSYNGVTLPDIESVWTDEVKKTYPYASIFTYEVGNTVLFAASVKFEYWDSYGCPAVGEDGLAFGWVLSDGEWTNQWEENLNVGNSLDDATALWANYDIINSDGTTYLAASDPVYTYDADVIIDGVGYKGAILPALPEWDREQYPYAVIYEQPANTYVKKAYVFNACKAPIGYYYHKGIIGGTTEFLKCSDDTVGYVQCVLNRNDSAWDEEWGTLTENTTQAFSGGIGAIEIWANHDVNYTDSSYPDELDGTLYLPATDPIPVGEIVGYSYNGVTLPELPEWDREQYPYAMMTYNEGTMLGVKNGHYLYCSKSPIAWNGDNSSCTSETDGYLRAILNGGATEWGTPAEMTGSLGSTIGKTAVWANHDVVDSADNTTVCLSASEPIPVYEIKE